MFASVYPERKKIIVSSVVGAVFSCVIFIDFNIFVSFLIKILSAATSTIIAFGFRNKLYFLKMFFYSLRIYMIFTGVVIFLGQSTGKFYVNNFCVYVDINPIILVCSIISIYIFISIFDVVFSTKQKNNIFNFTIYINENEIKAKALYDTGFKLRDVMTNRNLILCDKYFISLYLEKTLKESIDRFLKEGVIDDKRIIPVFYSDVSNEGMMPGVKIDNVICEDTGKKIDNVLLVITGKKLEGEINLLFGKEVYNMIGE